jgi:excisionase family DNA binding protein
VTRKARPRQHILKGSGNGHAARRYAKIDDAAQYLGVSPGTIDAMLRDGRLTRYALGPRIVRVDLNEVDAKMEAGGLA